MTSNEVRADPVLGVTLDARDPDKLAKFWSEALGYEYRPHPPDATWRTIHRPKGVDGLNHMHFQKVPEDKVVENRMHLDLFFTEADAQIQRLVELGATVVGEPENTPYRQKNVVMQDPESNEFCIVYRRKQTE